MIERALPERWTLRAVGDLDSVPEALRGRDIGARVPGCVHTDLLAAGLIDDPYRERNELSLQWIGETDWRYACTFEVAADLLACEHVDLVCEGLDTVARLELNGELVGTAENMHVAYRFALTPHLRAGPNELAITFTSAVRHGQALQAQLGELPNVSVHGHAYNFIRKMACNFGWDWGPTLVTAGVWRPIYLAGWSGARLTSVRPLVTRADVDRAEVTVHVAVGPRSEGLQLSGVLVDAAGNPAASFVMHPTGDEATATLTVDDPQRWWPRGHGDQPLYTLELNLTDAAGTALDTWSSRLGLRTVALDTREDAIGAAFTIAINGTPIFCKGANWIPDDCFPTRVGSARYRERLEQAASAGMNMLRVWGGGIYEADAFYDVCDELGLMVWQDFAFACAMYPEEPPFDRLVEEEARYQIVRLVSHPSLVLWNGNNENIWGYFDWAKGGRSWHAIGQERSWGLGFYLDLLPRLVTELDPSRPYWPGSPYSGSMELHPNDDRYGCKHVWDAWNECDYTVYRDYTPRFVAEFGHQAPPSYATLLGAMPADRLAADSPDMLHHQKAVGGSEKLMDRLREHFPAPEGFDAWHYLTQVNQARALQLGIEWFRSRHPVCQGTLYWQLNDCWPVISWAAIDGDGRPKPLYFATKRFFADRLVTIQPNGAALELHAINDADGGWSDRVIVRRLTLAGTELARQEADLSVAPRASTRVCLIDEAVATPCDPRSELLVASAGELRGLWFFARDEQVAYPAPRFGTSVERDGSTYRLTITAETLLRDLCVFVDRLDPDATVSDQLVTLLPGESVTVSIQAASELDQAALARPPVIACVNAAVRRHP